MATDKLISTYYADAPGEGYAEVWFDYKEERAHIKYFNKNEKQFFTEEFPNNSLRYVEDAAENWALNINIDFWWQRTGAKKI